MKTKLIGLTVFLGAVLMAQTAFSQVLHSESFNVVLDTSRVVKGNFSPGFRFRNVKKDYLEIENTSDISIRLKNHALTLANKVEYSIFGGEKLLSGGFVYVEHLSIQGKKFAFEPFFQMHWREQRGLDSKYAGGLNFRWRTIVTENTGLFFGIGSLYESERWNYSGVPDELLPDDTTPIETEGFRGTSYISYKQRLGSMFDLDISGYYQPTFSAPFDDYRLASSFELTYNLTRYLGFRFLYQNIYDSEPLVSIDELYHDVNFGITLSF